jgi:hypothetical protein
MTFFSNHSVSSLLLRRGLIFSVTTPPRPLIRIYTSEYFRNFFLGPWRGRLPGPPIARSAPVQHVVFHRFIILTV